jgi:hypothetical protein
MSCNCGVGATMVEQTPDWLTQLIRAIRGEAIAPRDARVRSMWSMLRQRGLVRRSPWLRNLLLRIWRQGLAARPRPRTTQRLLRLLRRWRVLPASALPPIIVAPVVAQPVVVSPGVPRPLRPVAVHPLRPVAVKPVRPVHAVAAGRRVAR